MASVKFTKSKLTLPWKSTCSSILELAEDAGLSPDFGCRTGNCGACMQKVTSGHVHYPEGRGAEPDPGCEFICCCIPKGDVVIDA